MSLSFYPYHSVTGNPVTYGGKERGTSGRGDTKKKYIIEKRKEGRGYHRKWNERL